MVSTRKSLDADASLVLCWIDEEEEVSTNTIKRSDSDSRHGILNSRFQNEILRFVVCSDQPLATAEPASEEADSVEAAAPAVQVSIGWTEPSAIRFPWMSVPKLLE